jgi:hypothetical protein
VNRLSLRGAILLSAVVAAFSMFGAGRASAQPGPNDGQWNNAPPVYQQQPSDGRPFDKHRRDNRRDRRDSSFRFPQTSSAWFQRPYPYHLDYYKMRYGGSYAPYFGNLYGPSGFPAYYGPYYGGYGGYGAGYGNGYPPPGYSGAPVEYPVTAGEEMPETRVEEAPLPAQIPAGAAAGKTSGNTTPAATP